MFNLIEINVPLTHSSYVMKQQPQQLIRVAVAWITKDERVKASLNDREGIDKQLQIFNLVLAYFWV